MLSTRRPRHHTALLWALCLSSADSFLFSPCSTTLRRCRTGTSTSRCPLLPNTDCNNKIKPNNNNARQRCIIVTTATTTDNSSNQPERDDDEEEEWHPRDPAYTIPQLLEGVWFQISQGKTMVKGDSITVLYPQMEDEYLNNPRFMNLLFAHLDACKDVCDHFGITTTLTPYREKKRGNRISGFQVQSFRNPDRDEDGGGVGDSNKEFQFEYDPIWDDGTDFEALYDGIDDVDIVPDTYPAIEKPVPDSDDEIMELTKNWVAAVVSDMGVCPFAQSAERAGLPVGNVFYTVSRCSSFEDMYTTFWKEVARLEYNDEKTVSTTLLIAPEFCLDNIELFDSFCNTLTQPLTALKIEDLLQLVFFHPNYTFRDGDARQTAAANYARRSPWPMINLLRTKQVRAAQKGIPTGLVYKQNEKTLSSIGVDALETMLRRRNWEDTAAFKVNRKEVDALKIAQTFQETGQVPDRDTRFEYDTTPAANKLNKERQMVGGGNLVKVVMQALEKRLGKDGNALAPLSGPITSATAMATDVLLDELYALATTTTTTTAPVVGAAAAAAVPNESSSPLLAAMMVDEPPPPPLWDGVGTPPEIERARQQRLEAARRALLDDYAAVSSGGGSGSSNSEGNPSMGRGDPLQDVLFGRGGITSASDGAEDNEFPEGMDPRSFY